jgi:hypothetical protein
MRRLKWIAGLAVVMISAAGIAQDKQPRDLSSLKGTWTADCKAFAPGARCSLQWTDGLHKNLLRVVYQVRNAAGNQLFAGEGVYQRSDDIFAGFWNDTNGSLHPLQATYTDGGLTTYWGRAETEEGKTRYALNAEGGLSVTDWVKKNGSWHQFMHADYQRD